MNNHGIHINQILKNYKEQDEDPTDMYNVLCGSWRFMDCKTMKPGHQWSCKRSPYIDVSLEKAPKAFIRMHDKNVILQCLVKYWILF